MSDAHHHKKHTFRFYVVLTTVVLAAIMVVLLFNNNPDSENLTSLAVSQIDGEELPEKTSAASKIIRTLPVRKSSALSIPDQDGKEGSQSSSSYANEVELSLEFDQIPTVKKEIKTKQMALTFDDLTTKINVNKDKLELSNLKEVTLTVEGFEGDVDFDHLGMSLKGTAKSIAVNDVTLSSKGEIDLSFDDLDYETLSIEEIELSDLSLETGDGMLKVADKLTYELEKESMKVVYFNGKLDVDRGVDTKLALDGVARGVGISGALLNLNLS